MAIAITQEKKKQRYLVLVLALVIFAILFVAWRGFFRSEEAVPAETAPAVIYVLPKVKIDWQLLENLRLENLQPVAEISQFKGNFGRNNPFMPY